MADQQEPYSRKPYRLAQSLSWLAAELTVVVIGVVLGLAFSAWWQDVQEQQEIHLSLARLSDNLQATLHDLSGDVGSMEQSAEAARLLINIETSELGRDSAALALNRLLDTRGPVPESAEYRALTSTGQLRKIANPEIVTAITTVYEQMPYLHQLGEISYDEARDLRKMLATALVYEYVAEISTTAGASTLNRLNSRTFTLGDQWMELLARTDVRDQIVSAGWWTAYQTAHYRLVVAEIERALSIIEIELQ